MYIILKGKRPFNIYSVQMFRRRYARKKKKTTATTTDTELNDTELKKAVDTNNGGRVSKGPRYQNILSFDCAEKSLAVCLATYDTHAHVKIEEIIEGIRVSSGDDVSKCELIPTMEAMTRIDKLNDNTIKLHFAKVYDITKGSKTKLKSEAKTKELKRFLTELDLSVFPTGTGLGIEKLDLVLIEYQMPSNNKSGRISHQLEYQYIDKAVRVHTVGPSLKNKMAFAPHLVHSAFMEKYATSYYANKMHCKKNFLHWLNVFGLNHFIKDIKKKNHDDIADAFMQMVAWVRLKVLV
jgi:hypothetical protein